MPIRDSLGSLRQLSISEGYTPPDKYWILQWEPTANSNVGSWSGSYFTTDGYLYLTYPSSSTHKILKINEYGQYRDGDDIQFPTSRASGNANITISYSYTAIRTTAGYDEPSTVVDGVQTTVTVLPPPLGPQTSNANMIYTQFPNSKGMWLVDRNSGLYPWQTKSYKADSTGYTLVSYTAALTTVRSGTYVDRYDLSGNNMYTTGIQYNGTNNAYRFEGRDSTTNSSNQNLIFIHAQVNISDVLNYFGLIFFLNSDGTISFALKLTLNSSPLYVIKSITIGDYVYCLATTTYLGSTGSYIVKLNATTGAVSACVSISSSDSGFNPTRITTDTINPTNVIVSDGNEFIVLNTSLTLLFQRKLSSGISSVLSDGIDSFYITSASAVLKTPSNGNILGTGTYTIGNVTANYTSISTISIATASNVATSSFTNYITGGISYDEFNGNATITTAVFDVNINSWNS